MHYSAVATDSIEKMSGRNGDYTVEIRPYSPRPPSSSDSLSSLSSYNEKVELLQDGDNHGCPKHLPSQAAKRIVDCFWISVNTLSTVAIVFLNKQVFRDEYLHNCQISIAVWHFFATFIILFLSTQRPFSLFTGKCIPLSSSVPLSILFAGFLVLGNLSLSWNSVGFYQLTKVLNTPAVVLFGWLLLRRIVSRPVLASVAAVCVGVTLTNSKLAWSNPAGTAIALAAVVVTALYQLWIASRIEALSVSAPQLLLNQSVISVLLLATIAPLIDVPPDFSKIPSLTIYALLASGVLAAFLNLSQFQFNIVSNIKTLFIVSMSWYLEHYIVTARDAFGILLALSGAYAYAHYIQQR